MILAGFQVGSVCDHKGICLAAQVTRPQSGYDRDPARLGQNERHCEHTAGGSLAIDGSWTLLILSLLKV